MYDKLCSLHSSPSANHNIFLHFPPQLSLATFLLVWFSLFALCSLLRSPAVRDDPESVWIIQAISRFCQLCSTVAPVWEEAVASSAGLLRMGRVHYDRQQTLGRRLNVRLKINIRRTFCIFLFQTQGENL